MTEQVSTTPTSDERMMGALAHFFGMIGAVIIWAIQKDKSRFVRFQAAQALALDFAVMLIMAVLFFCIFGIMFIGMFGTMLPILSSTSSPENFSKFALFSTIYPFLMFICIFPFSLAFLIARVVAVISILSGNNFHYPFLGTRVEKFLAD